MGDRDAKFATENLVFAASRIERGRDDGNVVELSRLEKQKGQRLSANPFNIWLPDLGSNQGHTD